MVLILSPGHPLLAQKKITLQDIARYPLLLREPGSAGRTFLDTIFDLHEIKVTPLWESTSTQAIVKAVASGFGVSVLPEQLVIKDIRSGRVTTKAVEDINFVRSNYLLWHSQKFLTGAEKEFITLCHKVKAIEPARQ